MRHLFLVILLAPHEAPATAACGKTIKNARIDKCQPPALPDPEHAAPEFLQLHRHNRR